MQLFRVAGLTESLIGNMFKFVIRGDSKEDEQVNG